MVERTRADIVAALAVEGRDQRQELAHLRSECEELRLSLASTAGERDALRAVVERLEADQARLLEVHLATVDLWRSTRDHLRRVQDQRAARVGQPWRDEQQAPETPPAQDLGAAAAEDPACDWGA